MREGKSYLSDGWVHMWVSVYYRSVCYYSLLDFFWWPRSITQPQTLHKLFEYITIDSNEDADPKRRFKYVLLLLWYIYPHASLLSFHAIIIIWLLFLYHPIDHFLFMIRYPFLACEILCSEIWTITEGIFRDESLLEILFTFLDQPPPLNPLLASYTSRVGQSLLSRRTSEVFDLANNCFVASLSSLVPLFVIHTYFHSHTPKYTPNYIPTDSCVHKETSRDHFQVYQSFRYSY